MDERIYDANHKEIKLTKEQEACLKYTGDKTLLIKGLAGSGKSIVLMRLAKVIKDQTHEGDKNNVVIFTYQNTLVSVMKERLGLREGEESWAVVSTINSYLKNLYERMVEMGVAPRRKYPFSGKSGEAQRLNNIKRAISAHQTKYGKHRFHDIEAEFWLEEFDWMKQLNVWTNDLDYYLTLSRKGRGGRVRMSAADRITAYQLFSMYCDYLEKTGQGDWADQTLYIIRNEHLIPKNMKFDNVLVDEAQDLTTAQMIAIMRLYNCKMVIAMDMNQKIHNRYWTPKSLGINTINKKLSKTMRTTRQIDALAESVRSKNDDLIADDEKSERVAPDKDDEIPKLVHLKDAAAEQKYVVELVKKYLKNPKLTIGIIAAKNKQIKIYSEWLTSANIPHEQITKDSTFSLKTSGVKVVSAYGAKGLEFNCVIIPMFAEGYFPYKFSSNDEEEMTQFLIKMRNLVYVSMTRATNLLTLTFWGKGGSRFIADMDKSLYQLEGEPFEIIPTKQPKKAIEELFQVPEFDDDEEAQARAERLLATAPKLFGAREEGILSNAPKLSSSKKVDLAAAKNLADFLELRGLEVVDKRVTGGCLWVIGDKRIDPVLKEARKQYGALWTYSERGGSATKHKPGWFTKSAK